MIFNVYLNIVSHLNLHFAIAGFNCVYIFVKILNNSHIMNCLSIYYMIPGGLFLSLKDLAPAATFLAADAGGSITFSQLKIATYFLLFIIGAIITAFLIFNIRRNLGRTKAIKSRYSSANTINEPEENDSEHFQVLNDHPTPTAVCSSAGMIIYLNKAFAEALGSTQANMQHLLVFNILPTKISSALSPIFNEIGSSGYESSSDFFSPATGKRYKVLVKRASKSGSEGRLFLTLNSIKPNDEKPGLPHSSGKEIVLQILNMAPYAMFIEDNDGLVLEANNKACEMQGVERKELVGNVMDELSPMNLKKEISAHKKSIANNRVVDFKSILYHKNGTPIPVQIHVSKVDYFGTEAIMLIIVDLTKAIENKKELDEFKIKAEESDRLKSSFLANLSHEVRTPMNSIMGFAELLAEPDISNKERKEFIKMIRQSGKELLSQINNIIDFSKIEAGLIQLKSDICNFETLFHQLHEYWLEESHDNGDVKLFFELPQNIIRNSIATDRVRLKQILKVFLSNSIKYTKKGVIEIGVRIKAPQLYEFYVRDTGLGIAESKHKEVFEQFRQADDSNEREFTGMGVGLSIASRLIQFLGGHQWVVSEAGRGSEFRFVLPDLLHPQGSPFLQVSCGPISMINKIMVVSPSEDIYLGLSQNSKPVNYQVFWAQNAEEMKAMLVSNNIRYILVAVDQLPFWQELLPLIKEINNEVEMIGVSNQLDNMRRNRLISMGLDEAIRSSVNIPILLNIMERKELSSMNIFSTVFHQN